MHIPSRTVGHCRADNTRQQATHTSSQPRNREKYGQGEGTEGKEWGKFKPEVDKTYMMPIDAIPHLTVLPVRTRVEARQERDGHQLVLGRLVLVLKCAGVPVNARPAQVMVVAELVMVSPLPDVVERCLVDRQERI